MEECDGNPVPNYCVAIQVANQEVISKVLQVQKAVLEREIEPFWHNCNYITNARMFRDTMVSASKLNVVLYRMYLPAQSDLKIAKQVLEEIGQHVHKNMPGNPIELQFDGMASFVEKVYYAKINESSTGYARLVKLQDFIQERFNERIKIPVDSKEYRPHLKIADISNSRTCRLKRITQFPTIIWEPFQEINFGAQRINGLQLLEINSEDLATGYYRCHGAYNFFAPS